MNAQEQAVNLLKELGITKPTLEQIAIAQKQVEAAAKSRVAGKITFKVGEKGGISVYGLQIRPVTLYVGQWERLIADDTIGALKAFIAENNAKLARKE